MQMVLRLKKLMAPSTCLKKYEFFWKTLFAYSGPGALVAVGYMDPGNWSTSITGGQKFFNIY